VRKEAEKLLVELASPWTNVQLVAVVVLEYVFHSDVSRVRRCVVRKNFERFHFTEGD
jgi:hypothetical protein